MLKLIIYNNICAADVILLSETRLITNENNNYYLIQNFEIPYRNDQIWSILSTPPHHTISYNKTTMRVLEKHKLTDTHFEGILLCIQHTLHSILV